MNLYAYCANNPICYVDPSGNICEREAERIMEQMNGRKANKEDVKNLSRYLREKREKGGIFSPDEIDMAGNLGIDVKGGKWDRNSMG